MNIHLGWVGSPPPRHVAVAADAARAVCPDCNVMLHVGEDVIPECRRAAMNARGLTNHLRSDIQRHAILQRYGGLWLDADVRLVSSPLEWAGEWDNYTAVRLLNSGGFVGTDIIYVPAGWPGWDRLNEYIDARLADTSRIGTLHLASAMILKMQRLSPGLFTVLHPGDRFPFDPRTFTAHSVVARGFDPPADPRPGLGDLVKAGLSAVGITEERVSRIIGRPCGCSKRAAALNKLGTYLGLPPGSTAPESGLTH